MTDTALSDTQQKFLRRLAWATLVPLGMLVAAMLLKPMWRDEFWSLYFSEPRFSLPELWRDRMPYEAHPPLYFTLLYLWRQIADTSEWVRALAVPFILFGALGAWLLARGRRELGLFLMIAAGQYWLIYFTTEARPYALLFVLCALQILISANILERKGSALSYFWWIVVGALIGLTHYPAAFWVGCIGLATGIGLLAQKRTGGFFAVGVASVAALLPIIAWLVYAYPMLGDRGGFEETPANNWQTFLTQMMRGLTVKLLGSNLALSCLVFAGVGGLWARRETTDRVLIGAALLFMLGTAAIDQFYAPMMRERSFMPMIPALLLFMARAILSVDPNKPWARRFMIAAPIVAVISPFLFIPEYFKDREKLPQFREYMATEAGDCTNAPVIAYMRQRWGHDVHQREFIDRQMRLAVPGHQPHILSTAEVTSPVQPSATCRVRGLAMFLRPNEAADLEAARAALQGAGLDLSQLEERRFGKGRNMLWVVPDTATHEAPSASPTTP